MSSIISYLSIYHVKSGTYLASNNKYSWRKLKNKNTSILTSSNISSLFQKKTSQRQNVFRKFWYQLSQFNVQFHTIITMDTIQRTESLDSIPSAGYLLSFFYNFFVVFLRFLVFLWPPLFFSFFTMFSPASSLLFLCTLPYYFIRRIRDHSNFLVGGNEPCQ